MTPEELAKGRKLYARLAYGYDFTTSNRPRTADEQALLDDFTKTHGEAYVDEWGERILAGRR